jgi:hypothetical protein
MLSAFIIAELPDKLRSVVDPFVDLFMGSELLSTPNSELIFAQVQNKAGCFVEHNNKSTTKKATAKLSKEIGVRDWFSLVHARR